LCYCKSTVANVYNRREEVCCELKDKANSITNEEYHKEIGSLKFQQYEKIRRETNVEYNASITDMVTVTHRTSNVDQITGYIQKRLQHEQVRENEMYRADRRGFHFYVFRKQQKAITKFVKDILGGQQNAIVLFGDGTFAPGGHGYAAVPKKKFLREFAQHAVVVLVDEFHTSKCCPRCYSEVIDVDDVTDKNERIRVCPTIIGNSPCFKADRDCIGAINIQQTGIFTLCGTPLRAFERA
jgi:hypothetical protein